MLFNINTFVISLLFINCKTNIIVLPFRSTAENFNFESNNFWKKFYSKELYTEVLIGDPPQSINLNINTESFMFYIQPNLCYKKSPSFYNYSKSSEFHVITFGFEDEEICDELGDGVYACDLFSFYNSTDLKTNTTKNGFQFFYSTYLSYKSFTKICGIIGLGLKQNNANYELDTFLNPLKKEALISDYSWTYKYFEKDDNSILNFPKIDDINIINNYEGLIIIGNYFNKNFSNKNDIQYYKSSLAKESGRNLKWALIFRKIYVIYEKTISINNDIHADLSLDYDYIISTNDYFEKLFLPFFSPYLEKKICKSNDINNGGYLYQVYFCDKNLFSIKDIKKFPKIFFYSHDFNYTFELTYDELFQEINDNIFFLIVKNNGGFNKDIWKLGKIFLRKYQFSFNQDSKVINFYVNMKNKKIKSKKNNGNTAFKFNINYFWITICIISLIIGIYIGNKIIIQNRKKRANELQDEYDYKAGNNDINNKDSSEKNIEMGAKGLGF